MSWHPAVKSDTATNGNTVGSVRTLDLGGPKLIESLTKYDATKLRYSYRITDADAIGDDAEVGAGFVTDRDFGGGQWQSD